MLTEEVEIFLSHHGIKGQKWGIRNQRIGSRPPLSVDQKLNIVNIITGGVVANFVGYFVANFLRENGTKPIVTATGTALASFGSGAATKALLRIGQKKILNMRIKKMETKKLKVAYGK